jgi:PhnB protein
MPVNAVPHLNFHGQAREALEFYRSVFGGQLSIATYGDLGLPPGLPDAEAVVFGQVVADSGFRIMAYDVPTQGRSSVPDPAGAAPATRRDNGMTLTSQAFFVSVRGGTVEEIDPLWDGLSAGATVIEAYGPSPWAPAYGMLTDRFGVTWVLDVAAGAPAV